MEENIGVDKFDKVSYDTLRLYFANIHGFIQPPAWVPSFIFYQILFKPTYILDRFFSNIFGSHFFGHIFFLDLIILDQKILD